MTETLDSITARVVAQLAELLERPVAGPITADSLLTDDLHLDSIEGMELLSELEDAYDVSIPVNVLQGARTLKDVARGVAKALQLELAP